MPKRSLPKKDGRSVFAVLYHQRVRSHGNHFSGRARKILFPASILVSVSLIRRMFTSFNVSANSSSVPLIQKFMVSSRSSAPAASARAPKLQGGMDVGEEKVLRFGMTLGISAETLEYVEFREIGFGFVRDVEIFATPAKSLPRGPFDPAGVHTAFSARLSARR